MKVAYYAPGIGRGRNARAAAICRHIPDSHVFLTNATYTEPLQESNVNWSVVRQNNVHRYLLDRNPEIIILDADLDTYEVAHYWPPSLRNKIVYIWRLGRTFPDSSMTTLAIEPGLDINLTTAYLCPVIYPDLTKLPTREQALENLNIPTDIEHLAVLFGSSADTIKRRHAAGVPPSRWDDIQEVREGQHWLIRYYDYPALNIYAAADTIYGPAGYNLFWETLLARTLNVKWHGKSPHQVVRANQLGTIWNSLLEDEPHPQNRDHDAAQWLQTLTA